MAHVQKFARGSVGGLSTHIERKTENHSNKEIDKERTHENYDLCEKEGDMTSRYQERLDEVHCLNRADVKVMADWIVTLPEELNGAPEGSQKQFFEETYDFLSERYGEENVLAGVVHNDETTPHMHFAFMPVTYDEKREREKVSAKEVLNRNELKSFHQDLDNHLKERIPQIYQKGVLNDKTIGVEDVPTLKKHSKEIERLNKVMDEKKRNLNKQIKKVSQLEGKAKNVYDTRNKLDELENKLGKTILGKRTMSSKDLNELKKFVTGVQKVGLKSVGVVERLEKENINLYADLNKTSEKLDSVSEHRRDLIEDKEILESKVERLEVENSSLEDKLTVANSKLLEKEYDLSKMPEIEFKGRLVIDRLEKEYEPKNKKDADRSEERRERKRVRRESEE